MSKSKKKMPFERSFASHPKSKYWSDKNDVLPRNVFKSARKKYKFNCPNCDEIYEANRHI